MLKITLDTNCIINHFDNSSSTRTSVQPLNEIVQWGLSGQVDLAVTTRVETDLDNDRNDARRTTLFAHLASINVIGALARWDTSKWDSGDIWATEEDVHLADTVKSIVFPNLSMHDARHANSANDIDHLVSHKIHKRDVFVTDEKDILRKKEALAHSCGIVVMSPQKCVDAIKAAIQP